MFATIAMSTCDSAFAKEYSESLKLSKGTHDYGNGLAVNNNVLIKYLKAKYPAACPVKSDYCEIKNPDPLDCPGSLSCTGLVFVKKGARAVLFEATINSEDWATILSKTEILYGKAKKKDLKIPTDVQEHAKRTWGTEFSRAEYQVKSNKGFLLFAETHGVDFFGGTNKPITSWTIIFSDKPTF